MFRDGGGTLTPTPAEAAELWGDKLFGIADCRSEIMGPVNVVARDLDLCQTSSHVLTLVF